jgi:hypothetical protein
MQSTACARFVCGFWLLYIEHPPTGPSPAAMSEVATALRLVTTTGIIVGTFHGNKSSQSTLPQPPCRFSVFRHDNEASPTQDAPNQIRRSLSSNQWGKAIA